MAGDISQFFGANKPIQRGVIVLGVGNATGTATISAVVTANTQVKYLGWSGSVLNETPYIILTNSTTITATRVGTTNATTVSWELAETY